MGRWEYSDRELLEKTTGISIPDLKAWGFLSHEGQCSGSIRIPRGEDEVGSMGVCVQLDPEGDSFIEFDYLRDGKRVTYFHRIEHFPLNYGNCRYYFLCKDCGKRVTALYLEDGYFACRHCHELVYQVCRDHRMQLASLNRHEELMRKSERLKRQGHPIKADRMRLKGYRYLVFAALDLQESMNRSKRKSTAQFLRLKSKQNNN